MASNEPIPVITSDYRSSAQTLFHLTDHSLPPLILLLRLPYHLLLLLSDLLELISLRLKGLLASAAVQLHLQLELLQFFFHCLAVSVLIERIVLGLHVDALVLARMSD